MKNTLKKSLRNSPAFTIVELIIIIVVIGILATIVVVGYNGLQKKAIEASMQSDLDTVAADLERMRIKQGNYPADAASFATQFSTSASGNNTFTYESQPYGYCLSSSNPKTSTVYRVKNTTAGKTESGACGFILNTTWVGSSTSGYADGSGAAVQFVSNATYGAGRTTVDNNGNIILVNSADNRIRKITPSGEVTTIAGTGVNTSTDGYGTSAAVNTPTFIVTGNDNTLYFTGGNRLRKINPTTNYVSTIATITGGVAGVDSSGNIWLTDAGCVKKVSPTGTLLVTSGTCGTYGYADGPAATALFESTLTGAVDKSGNLFVADRNNNRIRKVTSDGTVSNYFGSGLSNGNSVPIDGTQSVASLNDSRNIAVDSEGGVWVTAKNDFTRIRRISPDGTTIKTYGGIKDGTAQNPLTLPEPGYISVDSEEGYIYVTGMSTYIWRIEF